MIQIATVTQPYKNNTTIYVDTDTVYMCYVYSYAMVTAQPSDTCAVSVKSDTSDVLAYVIATVTHTHPRIHTNKIQLTRLV